MTAEALNEMSLALKAEMAEIKVREAYTLFQLREAVAETTALIAELIEALAFVLPTTTEKL